MKKSWVNRFLGLVERLGNLLPHPVTLFALFALATILLSALGSYLDWSVVDPRPEGTKGRAADGMIRVESLLDGDGIRKIVTELVSNFVKFAPLGTVLVALLGVGVAEHSGLLSAAIRLLVLGAPRVLVTAALVFAGVISNTASEIGYVVIVPMGAAIFHSLGRHPLAGLAAAFAGVSGGYSANLLIGTVDPLLAGLTETAAKMIASEYSVNPACNWYFMIGSTFVITLVGTLVTAKIVEPRLAEFVDREDSASKTERDSMQPLVRLEKKGLLAAAATALLLTGLLIYLSYPIHSQHPELGSQQTLSSGWQGILRNPQTNSLENSALLKGVVAFVFLGFLIPGFVYGWVVGTMKSDRDVINSMSKSMSSMGPYIVLVFFAAQFVQYFDWSNLGTILAVKGSEWIRALKMDHAGIFVFFILVCALVNLLMGSASAKWSFMAPIFVPMLMLTGYSPEIIQAAYRIGDSCTNVISPMMSYFGMIFIMIHRYDKTAGMGSLISLMLPYSVVFLIVWTLFFYFWVFVLGLPLGPSAPIYFSTES